MDFELSRDQKVLRDAVRDFVVNEVKPIAMAIDEEHAIPDELVAKIGEMGFLRMLRPRGIRGRRPGHPVLRVGRGRGFQGMWIEWRLHLGAQLARV